MKALTTGDIRQYNLRERRANAPVGLKQQLVSVPDEIILPPGLPSLDVDDSVQEICV